MNFVLNVNTTNFKEIGYNIKKVGWLNNFTKEKIKL